MAYLPHSAELAHDHAGWITLEIIHRKFQQFFHEIEIEPAVDARGRRLHEDAAQITECHFENNHDEDRACDHRKRRVGAVHDDAIDDDHEQKGRCNSKDRAYERPQSYVDEQASFANHLPEQPWHSEWPIVVCNRIPSLDEDDLAVPNARKTVLVDAN